MDTRNITLKDIALALNLSVSTVSKALKDSYEISIETKKLIQDYARENHYRPNPMAQSLKGANSKTIAVLVSTIDNNFYSQVINGIESIAYDRNYTVVVSQTHESYERELMNVTNFDLRSVGGLLVSISTETDDVAHFNQLQERGMPVVYFDRVPENAAVHCIKADNFQGAYDATSHLIRSGYKRIAHITSPPHVSITIERLNGYKKALEDFGIAFDAEYVKYCAHGGKILQEMDDALDALFAMENKPDALFTASDRITTRSLIVLNRRGMKIPDEIGLIGFTNTDLAEALNPPLSCVQQPAFEMGVAATEMLIKLMERKNREIEFETKTLKTKLHIRESTR